MSEQRTDVGDFDWQIIAADLSKQKAALKRERDELREALNQIASWSEGETVTSSFDEPASAAIARAVLERTK